MLVPEVEVEVRYRCDRCGSVYASLAEGRGCCEEVAGAPPILTLPEVADRLQVSVSTVRNWVAEGRLPSMRVGAVVRVTETALAEFVAGAVQRQAG